MTDRTLTGIPGLDELMSGGLRERSVTAVEGGPGSGKSILCMQFLVEGARNGEPGLYVSFEETPDRIIDEMQTFPWKLQKLVADGKISIMHYSPEQVQQALETGVGVIKDTITSMGAKRLVVDSLTAFALMFGDILSARKAAFTLFEATRKWGCTTLVTLESEPDNEGRSGLPIEFEADAVILLYNKKKENIRERSLEILKMRGTKHTNRILPMKIEKEGVRVFPKETVY